MTSGYDLAAPPGDILIGAKQIALYLFGTEAEARRIYYLCDRKLIPYFRIGGRLAARKSELTEVFRG